MSNTLLTWSNKKQRVLCFTGVFTNTVPIKIELLDKVVYLNKIPSLDTVEDLESYKQIFTEHHIEKISIVVPNKDQLLIGYNPLFAMVFFNLDTSEVTLLTKDEFNSIIESLNDNCIYNINEYLINTLGNTNRYGIINLKLPYYIDNSPLYKIHMQLDVPEEYKHIKLSSLNKKELTDEELLNNWSTISKEDKEKFIANNKDLLVKLKIFLKMLSE